MAHQTGSTQSQDMQACIDACLACARACETHLYTHCLEKGGDHLTPDHVRVMTDCIEICLTAGRAMLRQSEFHAELCEVCAAVCTACADSCAEMDGMDECVAACRACAESCSEMAGMHDAA